MIPLAIIAMTLFLLGYGFLLGLACATPKDSEGKWRREPLYWRSRYDAEHKGVVRDDPSKPAGPAR